VSLYAFYRDENGEPRTPRRSDTGKPPLNEKYVPSYVKIPLLPRMKVTQIILVRSLSMKLN